MGWLHSLSHYPYEVLAQGFKIRLLSQAGVKGLKGLSGIVLPAVEALIDEPLHPTAQRVEQGCYQQGGGHHSEGGPLTRESYKDRLQQYDAAEVERDQRCRKGAVDDRAVYEDVYVIEPIAKDSYPHRNGDAYETNHENYVPDPL